MGLLNEYTTVSLNSSVISHYEKLGYTIPRVTKNYKTMVERGTTIQVKTTDLPKGSNVYVDVECDCCKNKHHMIYHKYTQNIDNHNGVYLCAIDNKHRQFIGELPTFDELIEQIKSFYYKYNRFPKYNEYKTNNGFTASYSQMMWILNDNNTTLLDELSKIDCFKSRPNIKYYGEYLKRLKEVVENGTLPSLSHLSQDNYCDELGLPNIRWLVDNCPDNNVKCIDDLREYAGLYRSVLSKEECTQQIYEMSKTYNRPLMYDDFRGREYGQPTIQNLRDYWGSLNKMKEALGLEIIQESMIDKMPSKEDFDNNILSIVNFVKSDNRDFITLREIDSHKEWHNCSCLYKYSKKYYGIPFKELLLKYNIHLGTEGSGISFEFEDGEKTTSQFEYMFSKFLRDNGFVYNQDYFRDVKYSSFIPEYKNNMNCDYVIHMGNDVIYIEIAGIIESYKEWFYQDRPITRSKSKEKYRLKLKNKENMLKEHGLKYYILFPCDLTKDNFKAIITNPNLDLKKNIESFMKNNIDWCRVREIGELKYTDNIAYGRRQIDYGEAI